MRASKEIESENRKKELAAMEAGQSNIQKAKSCYYCQPLIPHLERLLVLATKHCPSNHHDWSEIRNIAKELEC